MQELYKRLVEAALEQPSPTPELKKSLDAVLVATEHRNRLLSAARLREMQDIDSEIHNY